MAMAATAQTSGAFSGVTNDQFLEYLFFSVAATGNYTTGGDTLSFQGVSTTLISPFAPLQATINGQGGFIYQFIPGADQTSGKVKVLTGAAAQSPLAELTQAAYPAGVKNDVITGIASFARA